MRNYNFSLYNVDRGVIDSRKRLCVDDLDALDQAARIWKEYIIEVREGGTFIARIKPGGEGPNERDPASLMYPTDMKVTPARSSRRR